MTYEKEILIDAKGHLMGRLASTVAKQLLSGQKITIVRMEELQVSGSFFRNKLKFESFLRKRCLINPQRGAFHFRSPSRMFYRCVRGMIPHKTSRGAQALERLKVFEGCPSPYSERKRMVVPQALRVLKLAPGRKFTTIKRLSHEFGWKYANVVESLEEKRKLVGKAYHEKKVNLLKQKRACLLKCANELKPVEAVLKSYGH